jgi:membrane AbrB-like protein
MNHNIGVIAYIFVGFIGGFIGYRLKFTGGTLIGAMLAVILLNLIIGRNFKLPSNFTFVTQVLIGITVGASFSKEISRILLPILLPVLISTLVLFSAGIIVSIVLVKIGLLDPDTAFFSTSPGAMGVLLGLAGETDANLSVVVCFHLFRIFFIILTAPFAFRFLQSLNLQ